MKDMLIVFFVASLILMLIFFPFKSRLMGHFNLLEMKGFYSFKVWRIKILCGRISAQDGKLKVENINNKIKDKYKDEFSKKLAVQLLKAINVKKVELFFTGGFSDNSFTSAMLCGTASLVVDMVYSFLSQTYQDVRLYEDITPTFNNDSLELTFDFVVEISIFQILKSMISAKLIMMKESKV